MKILFIGDIVGRPGRRAVARCVPRLRDEHGLDMVIANAENSAGGLGATPDTLKELRGYGVHAFTMGNHTWRKKALVNSIGQMGDIVRPANYPDGVPGRGSAVVNAPDGTAVGLVQVLGRIYMEAYDCPFRRAALEVDRLRRETPIVIVDVHAEATSEKVALGWHLAGRCTAVLGTHTHVATGDERILPGGTAYITDVGLCGPRDGVIGVERDLILEKFLTGLPREFKVAQGPTVFSAVIIELDKSRGTARHITRIRIENETEERFGSGD